MKREASIWFVLVFFALVVGVVLGGACRVPGPTVKDLNEKRLELEGYEDRFCATRAKIRAIEIDAGIEVPDSGMFVVPRQGNSQRSVAQ